MRCPYCNSELTADIEVYTRWDSDIHSSREIIGCEFCIRDCWADEFFDEEEFQEEISLEYLENIWADARRGIL